MCYSSVSLRLNRQYSREFDINIEKRCITLHSVVRAVAEVIFRLKNAAFQWVIDATSGSEIKQGRFGVSSIAIDQSRQDGGDLQ
jgi:hypothetical protein